MADRYLQMMNSNVRQQRRREWGVRAFGSSQGTPGVVTTTPLQLARAYSILGNGGYSIEPSVGRSVVHHRHHRHHRLRCRRFS